METISVGDIVEIAFPFEENPKESKVRPGFVIAIVNGSYRVLKITTSDKKAGQDWFFQIDPPPLRKVSYVDLRRVAAFERKEIIRKVGSLGDLKTKLLIAQFRSFQAKK